MVKLCSISPSKALMTTLLLGLLLFVWLLVEQNEVTKIGSPHLVKLRGKKNFFSALGGNSLNKEALLQPAPSASAPSALSNATHQTGNLVKLDQGSSSANATSTNKLMNEITDTASTEAASRVTTPSNESLQAAPPTSVILTMGDSNKETTNSPTKLSQTTVTPTFIQQTSSPSITLNQTTALHHLNYTEILHFFQKQPLQYERIPQLFPTPINSDDFELAGIYSRNAWSKLRDMLHTRDVTMLVTGASSVAGAGGVVAEDRCQSVFARSYKNVTIVDRCHGSRSTFHSTQNMHSYFPAHVDMVLWEFAINDPFSTIDANIRREELQNYLMLYLEQLDRVAKERQQEPPLVFLLYLWNTPFGVSSGSVRQETFDLHHHVGEKYDFVVGYVNAAKYFASWQLDDAQTKSFALADCHHPNAMGHMMIAYLLNDLVMNKQRPDKPIEVNQTETLYQWACGEETAEKRLMRDLLTNRHPVASFTSELPKNDKILAGMLTPDPANVTMRLTGEIHPVRSDRQYYVIFPCCGIDESLSFDVSRYSPLHGIEISVFPETTDFTVYFDGQNVTDKHINTRSWGCLSCHWDGFRPQNWIVLDQPGNLSVVSFCDNSANCRSDLAVPMGLFSMTAYGGNRNVKFA